MRRQRDLSAGPMEGRRSPVQGGDRRANESPGEVDYPRERARCGFVFRADARRAAGKGVPDHASVTFAL
jgi:hypothetical protein